MVNWFESYYVSVESILQQFAIESQNTIRLFLDFSHELQSLRVSDGIT